jgi:hypothetical protein
LQLLHFLVPFSRPLVLLLHQRRLPVQSFLVCGEILPALPEGSLATLKQRRNSEPQQQLEETGVVYNNRRP